MAGFNIRSFIEDTARAAGQRALELRAYDLETDTKNDGSLVTQVDKATQELIVAKITSLRPTDGFLGEEGLDVKGSSGLTWVIDPIDGTNNFIHGKPFGVSIGLVKDNKPVLGVVYLPETDEIYSAVKGVDATRNGKPITLTSPIKLSEATISNCPTRSPESSLTPHQKVSRLNNLVDNVITSGAAVVSFMEVAANKSAGAVMNEMNVWDVAASLVICTEAGAKTTATSELGEDWQNRNKRYSIVLGAAGILDELDAAWANAQNPSYTAGPPPTGPVNVRRGNTSGLN